MGQGGICTSSWHRSSQSLVPFTAHLQASVARALQPLPCWGSRQDEQDVREWGLCNRRTDPAWERTPSFSVIDVTASQT